MEPERRHADRFAGPKGKWVAFIDGIRALPCTIQNISDAGACLTMQSAADELPATFQLATQGGEALCSCRIIWRQKNRVGVKFE